MKNEFEYIDMLFAQVKERDAQNRLAVACELAEMCKWPMILWRRRWAVFALCFAVGVYVGTVLMRGAA